MDSSCVTDLGPCASDEECQEDSYCHENHCVPYGEGPRGDHNPECAKLFLAGLFQPSIQCEWTGPPPGDPYPNHVRVLSTPMVVDFDFDGDGRAEVSCSGSDSIAVFDPDCQGTPDAAFCESLAVNGVLWWQPSQDHSSNITGSSLFDFEGDGSVEVVCADEVFTRVYSGRTGEVLLSPVVLPVTVYCVDVLGESGLVAYNP